MAGVPPIPRAKVSTAAAVKTGDNRNCRKAYRKFPGRFCMAHPSIHYEAGPPRVPLTKQPRDTNRAILCLPARASGPRCRPTLSLFVGEGLAPPNQCVLPHCRGGSLDPPFLQRLRTCVATKGTTS